MLQLVVILGIIWTASAEVPCVKGPFPVAVTCMDAHFKAGEPAKLEEQTARPDIAELYLRNVSGTVDATTFSNFPNAKDLTVAHCNFEDFAPNLDLDELAISNSAMPTITREMMKRFDNLTNLKISENPDLEIEIGAFVDLKKLQVLLVAGQELEHLTSEFLDGLENLVGLQLSTGITDIDEDAFDSVTKLEELILEDNEMSSFRLNTFSKLKDLKGLSLVGCRKLQSIDLEKVFQEQKNLEKITLPTQLVKNGVTVPKLTSLFPKLQKVSFEYDDQECEEIKKMVDELEKLKIETTFITSAKPTSKSC